MPFRVATLNLERNEKRWQERRQLVIRQLADVRPDIFALNEIWLPDQTGQWLQAQAQGRFGFSYELLEQARAAETSHPEAEGLLTRFKVIERSHRFFSARDTVTLVVRVEIQNRRVDVYVTHLYPSRREESARVSQVQELLTWIKERGDVEYQIVCGDCNAPLEMDSMKLMAEEFQPTQSEPTAFTPLRETDGAPSHPEWERFDRCIDFIWISDSLKTIASGLCFNQPAKDDPTL